MDLQFVSPTKLKTDYNFSTPSIIVFKYPAAGGTHMNVIFDQQGETVMCMEPFYPLVAAADGSRKGIYVRARSVSLVIARKSASAVCRLKTALTELRNKSEVVFRKINVDGSAVLSRFAG
jgi:hypothetical protein